MTQPTVGRADFGPHHLADHLGLYRSDVDRARELGLLPAPDADGDRGSAAAAAALTGQLAQAARAARRQADPRRHGMRGAPGRAHRSARRRRGRHHSRASTDADVATGPSRVEIVPQLLAVAAGRHVLCCDADCDAGVVRPGITLDHPSPTTTDGVPVVLAEKSTDMADQGERAEAAVDPDRSALGAGAAGL